MPMIMHGNWTVGTKEKNAAFPQRFIIEGASSGNGTYDAPHAPVYVTGPTWSVRIQSQPRPSSWADSEYQITFPVTSAGQHQFDVQSNDVWEGDKDFNDLVLTFSTPVTQTDFLVYGHVSMYAGCFYNPCLSSHILIESLAGMAAAQRYPLVNKVISELHPQVNPPFRAPLPDPPPDVPASLLLGQTFRPIVIPLEEKTFVPPKKAQIVKAVTTAKKPTAEKPGAIPAAANLVATRVVEVGRAIDEISVTDRAALVKVVDASRRFCWTEALVNAGLRFQEYDRTPGELNGGAYTGEGLREELGQASTDRNGNYIFRFSRSLAQIIEESNVDVSLGEDESVYSLPDLIVEVLGATKPGGIQYETYPYWNVPVLKRINICIPSSY